ncbi:hypothetical protein G5S52_14740 [Grimontia sp. S25]|uniref:Uncharacterized protein n=1 Tax=Grimontia sedimenti TaxID=2711294 RepID=A0A6M1RF30_9GAMM|nr:hypothetical protein [Grimontia sedimenti]NGN98856.1 hypothetical protein [Grimontia sedimenti]
MTQEVKLSQEEVRRGLVPLWMKIFGWIFISLGVIAAIILLLSFLVDDFEVNFDFLGLTYSGSEVTPKLLLIVSISMFFAVSAFGLVRGKSWGLMTCIANGFLGLVICGYVMAMSLSEGTIYIRFEPIVQVIYLIKLFKIKSQWMDPDSLT